MHDFATIDKKKTALHGLNSTFISDRQGVKEQLAHSYCTVAAATVDDLLQPSTSGAGTNTQE